MITPNVAFDRHSALLGTPGPDFPFLTAQRLTNVVQAWATLTINTDVVPGHPHLGGVVVPGEPLQITWEFTGELGAFDRKSVSARVYHDGALLYTSPNAVVLHAIGPYADSGVQTATILPPSDPGISHALYQAGTKTLHLDVTVAGFAVPVTDEAQFYVVAEYLDPSWWEWTSPISSVASSLVRGPGPRVYWKRPYTIAGRFHNKSLSMLQLNATLYETDIGTSIVQAVGSQFIQGISAGSSVDVSYPAITQAWRWLIPVVWLPSGGPLVKNFRYHLTFTAEDAFGNSYSDTQFALSDLPVTVVIEDIKLWEAASALGHTAVAAAATVAAFFGTEGAWEVATTAAAAAQAFGAAALDPPEPDPNYKYAVLLEPLPEMTAQLEQEGAIGYLLTAVRLGRFIANTLNTMSKIVGKVLGARKYGDDQSEWVQLAAFLEGTNRVVTAAVKLLEIAPSAQAVVEKDKTLEPNGLSQTLAKWHEQGLPPEVRDEWNKRGYPEEHLVSIEMVVRDSAGLRESQFVSGQLANIAQMAGRIAILVKRESPHVIFAQPELATSQRKPR